MILKFCRPLSGQPDIWYIGELCDTKFTIKAMCNPFSAEVGVYPELPLKTGFDPSKDQTVLNGVDDGSWLIKDLPVMVKGAFDTWVKNDYGRKKEKAAEDSKIVSLDGTPANKPPKIQLIT